MSVGSDKFALTRNIEYTMHIYNYIMPSPSKIEPYKSKKSPEKKESQEEGKRNSEEVTWENEKARTKLANSTTKKPEEEKENNWEVGFGTTEARDTKNPLNSISSTGVKIKNEKSNFEVTAWIGAIQEQKVPWEIPKNTPGATIALNWKF